MNKIFWILHFCLYHSYKTKHSLMTNISFTGLWLFLQVEAHSRSRNPQCAQIPQPVQSSGDRRGSSEGHTFLRRRTTLPSFTCASRTPREVLWFKVDSKEGRPDDGGNSCIGDCEKDDVSSKSAERPLGYDEHGEFIAMI